MSTEKQRAANIENARKSTGPNTEGGKAISSQNALKTGIDAKCEVIKFESRPEYDTLISEFYHRFRPTSPEERSLGDSLIRSEWLSRRYMCVETSVWTREFDSSDHDALGTAFSHHAKRKSTETEPLNPKLASFRAFIHGPSEPPLAA